MGVVKMMPWYIDDFFWRVSADNVDITANYNQSFCQPEAEAAIPSSAYNSENTENFSEGFS